MAETARTTLRTREDKLLSARKMNLFNTPFMREVFKDDKATQHVLRILTGKKDLRVEQNLTEYRISKMNSRDAVLDVIAVDDAGIFYHIEIQLANSDDHIRRVRFYSAMVDSELLEKGTKYKDLPDTYIFYITLTDFMSLNQPIAQVKSTIGASNNAYEDGKHIFYVNASVYDESEVAKLMDFFKHADPDDSSQGELSDRVHTLKCDGKGGDHMDEITESFINEGKVIGYLLALRENSNLSDEEIMKKLKTKFDLTDYEAGTFVYAPEDMLESSANNK